MSEAEVTIDGLGAAGDGIAELDGVRLFVPGTLPGERWRVRPGPKTHGGRRAEPLMRLGGPPRAAPICPLFGRCGGCRLQHLPRELYHRFKLERITGALARRRLVAERLDPPAASPPASRRRLRLAWERRDGRVRLGFRAARSRAVVATVACPVARPELSALFVPLADLLAGLACAGGRGELLLTLVEGGVDLLLDCHADPGVAEREMLAAFAEARDLARLSLRRRGAPEVEPLIVRRPPELAYGPFRIPFPAGAFLQATEEGEAALRAFVAEALAPDMRLLDLYAGLGGLSLPFIDRLKGLAMFEASGEAVAAVKTAVRARPGSPVLVARRDLAKRPLAVEELAAFDLVLLDPPRAGARAQVERLAEAPVTRLVHVSCNPASFARDAAILAAGGWRLARLRPVDQFVHASEVELAALFLRDGGDRA